MLDSSWTIGIPPISGLWETLHGSQNGTFDDSFQFDHSKVIRITNWTVTPEGAWNRVECRYCGETNQYVLVNLDPAMRPLQDAYTTPNLPLDYKFTAYRPVQT